MKLTIGTQTVDLTRPAVMAIINVTPDSFFPGSRTEQAGEILRRARRAQQQGAALLDVGGYSSRPGADDVPPEEEAARLHRALEVIRKHLPQMPVSIDTFRAQVAEEIIRSHGPCIINDISAAEADPGIVRVAAEAEVPYIAMHMRGTPKNMQELTRYDDIASDIRDYFTAKTKLLHEQGVRQIVLDPGFGFSKTTEQNYRLLKEMHRLTEPGYPVLAGISRKSMIYKPLNTTPDCALNGTTALHWECLRQGASILRVHDTAQAVEVVRLFELFSGR